MRALGLVTRWMGLSHTPVHTSNGFIVGHESPNASRVIEYLGIPYAQPPIGDLRFAAPKPFQGDPSSTFNASEFVITFTRNPSWTLKGCPVAPSSSLRSYPEATDQFGKIIAAFGGSINHNRSEDCLTLNIWSKKTPNKAKPVIVYFYGGRYSIGTSNTLFYNGAYLADSQDVVVVTLNFRINVFGFSGAPNTAQNVGLLDQRLAVEWVRDNIRSFGGSPDRIVLAGQSSGSVAIDYWSFAYVDEPIASGYIEHSGNALSFGLNSNELALEHWYNISSLMGCGEEGDTLPCMRAIENITAIEEATKKIEPPPSSNPARTSPIFQPTPDDVTVFDEYKSRYENGNFSRLVHPSLTSPPTSLPILMGHNNNEAGYYKIPAFSQGTVLPAYQWEQFNDGSFTCPIAFAAQTRASLDIPTWRYRYFGDWDNLRLYGPSEGNGNEQGSGAYHGADVEMVTGASEDVSGLPKSQEERKMEMVFMEAWAAFAKDPTEGLEKLGWPSYDPDTKNLIRLGYDNKGKATFVKPSEYDYVCSNVTISGKR
ncbi:MAG: hypothetical protein Q9173_004782 [Seirophora scorigena]